MQSNTKISVVMPVYNAEQYLAQSLDSVLRQTLRELEVICVNDGSTDGSETILQSYARQDPRIRFYTQQNKGAGHARNFAIGKAEGAFITFLDADDFYIDPAALELLYTTAVSKQVLICGGLRQRLNRENVMCPQDTFRTELEGATHGVLMQYSEYQFDYHYHSFLYQTEMLRQEKIEFPGYLRFQDPPFFIRAMIAAKEFFVLPVELYCYRQQVTPLSWNEEKVCDLIRGLTDDLNLSREANLAKLHTLSISRIEHDYDKIISKFLHLPSVFALLTRANAAIDPGLIHPQTDENNDYYLLKPLKQYLRRWNGETANAKPALQKKAMFEHRHTRLVRTRLYRKLRGLQQCLQDHGFGYTLRRFVEHFGIPMDAELPRKSKKDRS